MTRPLVCSNGARRQASFALLILLASSSACGRERTTPAAASAPVPVASPTAEAAHHRHELSLPPVGPEVTVVFEGQRVDIAIASLPHAGSELPILQLFHAAFPNQDTAALRFDVFGSDGFHPSSRPPCARRLGAVELADARLDIVTHDMRFAESVQLPRCYHVRAVVRLEGNR